MTLPQTRRVGVEEADGGGVAFGGEAAGLVDELFGEIEGGEIAIAERPEANRHAAGTAAGLEQRGVALGEEALDEKAFGIPKAKLVRGARVVQDRLQIVEIGADRRGAYFFIFHAAMNMPLALSSWGQRVTRGSVPPNKGNGSSSVCAAVKASATAVVSLRVSVQTA